MRLLVFRGSGGAGANGSTPWAGAGSRSARSNPLRTNGATAADTARWARCGQQIGRVRVVTVDRQDLSGWLGGCRTVSVIDGGHRPIEQRVKAAQRVATVSRVLIVSPAMR
jgi:hypothetical protein